MAVPIYSKRGASFAQDRSPVLRGEFVDAPAYNHGIEGGLQS
jgi:hypothetical protein